MRARSDCEGKGGGGLGFAPANQNHKYAAPQLRGSVRGTEQPLWSESDRSVYGDEETGAVMSVTKSKVTDSSDAGTRHPRHIRSGNPNRHSRFAFRHQRTALLRLII